MKKVDTGNLLNIKQLYKLKFFQLVSNEMCHQKCDFMLIFHGLCTLTLFSLLTIDYGRVSNYDCLLLFFIVYYFTSLSFSLNNSDAVWG